MIRHGSIRLDRQRHVLHVGVRRRTFLSKGRRARNLRFDLLCHLLLGAGHSSEELFDLLYRDDPTGGPLRGPEVIPIMVFHLGEIVAHLGLVIVRWRTGRGMVYRIERAAEPMVGL